MGTFLAFLAPVVFVIADANKKRLSLVLSTAQIIWVNLLVAMGVSYGAIMLTPGHSVEFTIESLCISAVAGLCMALSEAAFMSSLRAGDFSLSQPFKAFAPIVAIPLSILFVHEWPTQLALIGTCITSLGAWLLLKPHGDAETKRGVAFGKAPLFMLISTFFSAVVGSFQRRYAVGIHPSQFFGQILFFEWLYFGCALIVQKTNPLTFPKGTCRTLLIASVLWGIGMNALYAAYSILGLIPATVIAQLQIVFAIFVAYFFFREKEALHRVFPVFVMLIGMLLVIL